MAYFVRIYCTRQEVLALYKWLDVFCPSWEFEASYGASDARSHAVIRTKNEEALAHFAKWQLPNSAPQLRREYTGIRVETEKEAMACRIHYLDCHVEPRGS